MAVIVIAKPIFFIYIMPSIFFTNKKERCCIDRCTDEVKYKHLCNRHYLQIKRYEHIVNTKNDISKIKELDSYAEIIIEDKNKNVIGVALIDKDDIDKCYGYKWSINGSGYAITYINNKYILLHKLIINNKDKTKVIDHINRNKLDNRKNNLRIVPHYINSHNRDIIKNNKGTQYRKSDNKWIVTFYVNNKRLYFGAYANKHVAEIVARQYMKQYNLL